MFKKLPKTKTSDIFFRKISKIIADKNSKKKFPTSSIEIAKEIPKEIAKGTPKNITDAFTNKLSENFIKLFCLFLLRKISIEIDERFKNKK